MVAIDAALFADVEVPPTERYVLADAALDQFSEYYQSRGAVPVSIGPKEQIADTVVAPPGDEFRMAVYHPGIRPPDDLTAGRVFVELP